jgi:hypothetical protein
MTYAEIMQIRTALCLHRSMAAAGERPSEQSETEFETALETLDLESEIAAFAERQRAKTVSEDPTHCDCGGELVYDNDHGRTFSYCRSCTPVVTVKAPHSYSGCWICGEVGCLSDHK